VVPAIAALHWGRLAGVAAWSDTSYVSAVAARSFEVRSQPSALRRSDPTKNKQRAPRKNEVVVMGRA